MLFATPYSDFGESGASFNRKFEQNLKCHFEEGNTSLIRAGSLAVFMPHTSGAIT